MLRVLVEKKFKTVSLISICIYTVPKTNQSQTSRFRPVLTSWNISPCRKSINCSYFHKVCYNSCTTAWPTVANLSPVPDSGGVYQRHEALLSICFHPIKLYQLLRLFVIVWQIRNNTNYMCPCSVENASWADFVQVLYF